jgi:AcrR family transcriptional regulator
MREVPTWPHAPPAPWPQTPPWRRGGTPSVYCHFTGKHDIIVAVVEERHRREAELLRRASGKESFASAIDDLMKNFIAVLDTAEEAHGED